MSRIEINTDKAPKAVGPYSQAIKFGNIVYTSGQIPIDPNTGNIINGDIKVQTTQVFENLKHVLNEAGASFDDVIKVTVFVQDLNSFGDLNNIYASYFKEPYPARSCVEVSRLPKDVLVEIEVIAEVR